MLLRVKCSNILIEDKRSIRLSVDIFLLVLGGIRIIVFSMPVLAIFSPESLIRSFIAVCTRYILFLTLIGRAANTAYDVWMGGTPASWSIISSLKLGKASYSYLF